MKKNSTKKGKVVLMLLVTVTVLYMLAYLVWRAVRTLPLPKEYGWIAFILGIALLVAEAVSAIESFSHCRDMLRTEEPEMPKIPDSWFPHVDVFIATHNEEEELLYKTINACTYLNYPDKSKVHIYVCDDGNRPQVAALCEKLKVGYFGLADNKLAKAGNLNNALSKTNSPYIVTFDADMIPNSNFLLETVPYFFIPKMKKDSNGNWIAKQKNEIDEKEKIGFIQLPQSFYNPDLFQYNLYMEGTVPNEQDYFFRQINVGRNRSNACIYAGSNTVISREALEEIDGIQTGTITEDFETGLRIEMNGYRCFAINKSLANGLAPTSIKSLIKQRERWGRGCVYSLRRIHLFLNPDIPFKMKIAYGACRTYWDSFLRRSIYISAPFIYALLRIPVFVCSLKELLIFWLPSYLLYSITLRLASGNIRSSRLSNIIDTIMFPYLVLPILAEVFHIHKKEFHVTEKSKEEENDRILVLPHLCLFVLSVVALVKMIKDAIVYKAYGSVIIIFWLFVNGSALLMAIFFMLGRRNMRNHERFACELDVELTYNDKLQKGKTVDISEGGFQVIFDTAAYLSYKEDNEIDIRISNAKYSACVKAIVVAVKKEDDDWKYSFEIKNMSHEDKKQYMQLIYDRSHTLPKKISVTSSIYGDIFANISRRVNKKQYSSRKLARIDVNRSYKTTDGPDVKIIDFNFENIWIDSGETRKRFNLILQEGIILECEKKKHQLYSVKNIDSLIMNEAFNNIIIDWENYEG